MKKAKRLTAAAASAVLALSAAMPVCSGAVSPEDTLGAALVNLSEGSVPASDTEITDRFYDTIKDGQGLSNKPQFYIDANKHILEMVYSLNDEIGFQIKGADNYDDIYDIAKRVIPDCQLIATEMTANNLYVLQNSDGMKISEAQVRELYASLSEKYEFSSFRFMKDRQKISQAVQLAMYSRELYLDKITDHIDENGLGWQIIDNGIDPETGERCKSIYVVPAEGSDVSEYLNIELSLSEAGIHGQMVFLADAQNFSADVDLLNAVEGDANLDGVMNMADAVFTMQAVSNPDKYGVGTNEGMTAQGAFNADIHEPGSGITNADALAVQRRMLSLG